jgi:hypothetical protein
VTDHNATDAFTYCIRVTDAATAAKLTYYGAKLFQLLRSLPVPPPP